MASVFRSDFARILFAALLALPLAGALHSQTDVQTRAKTAATQPGVSQGIGLSGWWKIDVRNADGTLARHIEFENAITPQGMAVLLNGISGQGAVTSFGITASGPSATGPCNQACYLFQSGTSPIPKSCGSTSVCSTSLLVSSNATGLTLAGSVTAVNAGTLTSVGTLADSCAANLTAGLCKTAAPAGSFTAATLANPLTLTAGQIVQFSVTFTFS